MPDSVAKLLDSVANWLQSPKFTLGQNTPFLYYWPFKLELSKQRLYAFLEWGIVGVLLSHVRSTNFLGFFGAERRKKAPVVH